MDRSVDFRLAQPRQLCNLSGAKEHTAGNARFGEKWRNGGCHLVLQVAMMQAGDAFYEAIVQGLNLLCINRKLLSGVCNP